MQTEVAAKSSKFFNAVTGIQDCWVEMDWDVHSWVPLVRPPPPCSALSPLRVLCVRVPVCPGTRVPGCPGGALCPGTPNPLPWI